MDRGRPRRRCKGCVQAYDRRKRDSEVYREGNRLRMRKHRASDTRYQHYYRSEAHKARAKLRSVATVVYSHEQLEQKLAYWGQRCWVCGMDLADRSRMQLDHVIPMYLGGPNVLANLRPACKDCNAIKNANWYGVEGLRELQGDILIRRLRR